jgi:hypothetical protein
MSRADKAARPCAGCGALVPVTDGPTHPYIGASSGCWAIYGEVLAREYGEYAYPPVHRLTVDAYAAQHPGVPSRRSIRSVAIHLISLHLILERGYEPEGATAAIRDVLARGHDLVWLDPPASPGAITVLDVVGARDLAEHAERVGGWAGSVWEAWEAHHGTIRRWADP